MTDRSELVAWLRSQAIPHTTCYELFRDAAAMLERDGKFIDNLVKREQGNRQRRLVRRR